MLRIYNSLKDGMSEPAQWFGGETDKTKNQAEKLKERIKETTSSSKEEEEYIPSLREEVAIMADELGGEAPNLLKSWGLPDIASMNGGQLKKARKLLSERIDEANSQLPLK